MSKSKKIELCLLSSLFIIIAIICFITSYTELGIAFIVAGVVVIITLAILGIYSKKNMLIKRIIKKPVKTNFDSVFLMNNDDTFLNMVKAKFAYALLPLDDDVSVRYSKDFTSICIRYTYKGFILLVAIEKGFTMFTVDDAPNDLNLLEEDYIQLENFETNRLNSVNSNHSIDEHLTNICERIYNYLPILDNLLNKRKLNA